MDYINPLEISHANGEGFMPSFVNYGFSFGVRKEIFKRDNGECQECGGSFYEDRLIMNAAHITHDVKPSDPEYDTPDMGRLLCIEDHLKQHLGLFMLDFSQSARQSLRLITIYAYDNGYHLRDYMREHPEQLFEDRKAMESLFEDIAEQTGFPVSMWDFVKQEDGV